MVGAEVERVGANLQPGIVGAEVTRLSPNPESRDLDSTSPNPPHNLVTSIPTPESRSRREEACLSLFHPRAVLETGVPQSANIRAL